MDKLTDTYVPSAKWLAFSASERLAAIEQCFKENAKDLKINVEQAGENGHIVVRIEEGIAASKRGLYLLDLEANLKDKVDVGLTLWLEPVGDKSKLRQLRGVDVKS